MNKRIKKERLYNQQEYIKCLNDPYYFIKKYCVFKDKRTGKLLKPNISKEYYERFNKLIFKQNCKSSR